MPDPHDVAERRSGLHGERDDRGASAWVRGVYRVVSGVDVPVRLSGIDVARDRILLGPSSEVRVVVARADLVQAGRLVLVFAGEAPRIFDRAAAPDQSAEGIVEVTSG